MLLLYSGDWRNALERKGLKGHFEKCTGEKRPESEPDQDRVLKAGGVDDREELKSQEEKVKRAKNF